MGIKKHIPNSITCCNLISGCIATTFAFIGDAKLALCWIVIGAVLAAVLKSVIARRQENREGRLKNAERIGTLFSAGLIVGESLIGVIMAFIIAFSVTNGGSDAPLALNLENWDTAAKWLGLAFFVFDMFVFARRVLKAGR